MNVLWEYKTRGILTTTIFAIVALDDGLALLLYGIASSVAGILLGKGNFTFGLTFLQPFYEILGAFLVGGVGGLTLNFILKGIREQDVRLAFAISLVLLVLGFSTATGIDLILSSMVMGVTLGNLAPRRSQEVFELVEKFALPIFILFFVLVGARLNVSRVSSWVWILVLLYVGGRSLRKILGAKLSGASRTVQKYGGFCLFSQAGVAVGLFIMTSHHFGTDIGQTVILVIASTTLLLQLIGPPWVKFALEKAGEVDLNITEEDLIETYRVGDVMDKNPPTLRENIPLSRILRVFSENDYMDYPVVDKKGRLLGILTIEEIKETLASEGLQTVLVAYDMMKPVVTKTTPDSSLQEALNRMRDPRVEYMPVVLSETNDKLVGFIEQRVLHRTLAEEILKRREKARRSENL